MKIGISGNRNKNLCKYISDALESAGHTIYCMSRETGFDFNDESTLQKCADAVMDCDIFINLYANKPFKQTRLAQLIWHTWNDARMTNKRIINVGSTQDNFRKQKTNIYHYEKLALKEWSNGFSIAGVYDGGPKVTMISIGTLANKQDDNPDKKCLEMAEVANYFKWIIDQPSHININNISLDHIQ
jgi:hypothetical protein